MVNEMVVILMGPMGCGKTTIGKKLAERLGWRFEDGDDYHPPVNITKMKLGIPLGDADRLPWLAILHDRIRSSLQEGDGLVLACSALKKIYRQKLGIDQTNIISVYLQGGRELLEQRIAGRSQHYMSKNLLASQLATLEEPKDGLIVNIDGEVDDIVSEIVNKISKYSQTGKYDEA